MAEKSVPAFIDNGAEKKILNRNPDGTYTAKKASVDVEEIEAGIDAAAAAGLPSVTSSDNGKLMQVKSGKWQKINGIPEVTGADNRKIPIVDDGKWTKSENILADYAIETYDGLILDSEENEIGVCNWTVSNEGFIDVWGYVKFTLASSQQLGSSGWYYAYTPFFYLPEECPLAEQISSTAMLMKGHNIAFIASENHDMPISGTETHPEYAQRMQYLLITWGGGSGTLTDYYISFRVTGR